MKYDGNIISLTLMKLKWSVYTFQSLVFYQKRNKNLVRHGGGEIDKQINRWRVWCGVKQILEKNIF